MIYYCDNKRHLICDPYTVENLHAMAKDLGIKKCWFHASDRHAHYDIPKRRYKEISSKCEVVTSRKILKIMSHSSSG